MKSLIYIIYMCVYIYILRERERERERVTDYGPFVLNLKFEKKERFTGSENQ